MSPWKFATNLVVINFKSPGANCINKSLNKAIYLTDTRWLRLKSSNAGRKERGIKHKTFLPRPVILAASSDFQRASSNYTELFITLRRRFLAPKTAKTPRAKKRKNRIVA